VADLTPDRIMRLRSLEKWFVPIPELTEVSMPVDITDEQRFPNIAEACRDLRNNREIGDGK
jgi:hypothetical protein